MSFSAGLKYKPVLNKDIAGILDKVGLVHMFEFSVDKQNHDYLGNLSSAVSGKASGACTRFGEHRDFYNKKNGLLEVVATSTIKQKYPFELFSHSNVGVLINPEKAQFIYLSHKDVGSCLSDFKNRTVRILGSIHPLMDEVNCGEEVYQQTKGILSIPMKRSDVDSKKLDTFFKNEFMNEYDNQRKMGKFLKPLRYNEIGISFPKEAVEAVIIYSDEKSQFNIGYDKSQGKNNVVSGVMLANLFIEGVQQKSGKKLPLIHYDLKLSGKTSFNEVEIENRKVVNILNKDPYTKAHYKDLLGKDYVQNMILGKTDIIMDGV